MTGWTAFAELDVVLDDLRSSARRALGSTYIGCYLQGSFALGAGDAQSDADFVIVATELPSGAAEAELRRLHDEIPTRPGSWNRNIEGSYAAADSLRSLAGLGVPWLFNNRGHRTLEWDLHCNTLHTREILRTCGIVVDGPPVEELVDAVPAEALKEAARRDLPHALDEIRTWADMNNAWTQKYIVQTCSRMLYTATTGRVASKPAALAWARDTLAPEWRSLLAQVADDRGLAWQPVDPARPGSMEQAQEYARYVVELAQQLR